jgi:hypothetical protein
LRDLDPRKELRIMETQQSSAAGGREARRAEWRQVLAELDASGECAAAFGRARGIPAWKMSYWRKALKPVAGETQGGFVQMRVASSRTPAAVWVEAGRWRVGVEPGFDATTLRQVIEVLAT